MVNVRGLQGWRIVRLLKQRRILQLTVAQKAGCSQATVCRVIARKRNGGEITERVWRALEEVLG